MLWEIWNKIRRFLIFLAVLSVLLILASLIMYWDFLSGAIVENITSMVTTVIIFGVLFAVFGSMF